jgi:hypothetical protein
MKLVNSHILYGLVVGDLQHFMISPIQLLQRDFWVPALVSGAQF